MNKFEQDVYNRYVEKVAGLRGGVIGGLHGALSGAVNGGIGGAFWAGLLNPFYRKLTDTSNGFWQDVANGAKGGLKWGAGIGGGLGGLEGAIVGSSMQDLIDASRAGA